MINGYGTFAREGGKCDQRRLVTRAGLLEHVSTLPLQQYVYSL